MDLVSFTFGGVGLLIQQYAEFYRQTDLAKTLPEFEQDFGFPRISEYDYIVVGSGTAGSLLATRLSETYKVLLLEKGGTPVPHTYPWMFYSDYKDDPNINDAYKLMPQENFGLETPGDKFAFVGRMLGGTGSHNADVYNRGSPFDYDHWGNLTGDPSWSYKNMLHSFKRIEDFVGRLVKEDERHLFYGRGGPLEVMTQLPPYLREWLKAGKELGFKVADPNAYQTPSFSTVQSSMRNGIRESSYTAYLKRAESRRNLNLKVLRYSEVDRILFANKTAYGVAYRRHGFPQIAHARKEIILSAGTFASPIILIKSGIGPINLLQEAEIPVVADVPGVGKNLQDHPGVTLIFTGNGSAPNDIEFQAELQKFHSPQKHGNLSYYAASQAFIASFRAKANGESSWADLHLISFLGQVDPSSFGVSLSLGRPNSIGEMFFNVTAFKAGERDTVNLGRPDFKYFSAEGDLDIVVEGVELGVKVVEETEAFRNLGIRFLDTAPSACGGLAPRSDDFWRCYVRQRSITFMHNVGTCKMGSPEDEMAVVDSKLRVKGVERLRVIDASVMPKITNANTNAPTLGIAEKIVAEMLHDGGLDYSY